MLCFDSDYVAGCAPEVMEALVATNAEATPGYGYDAHCLHARALILGACGLDNPATAQAEVHFLVGGTQTNATVLDGLLRPWQGVLAASTAHIAVHEAGAIEAAGHKVIPLPSHQGKIMTKDVERYIADFYRDETNEHMVQPGAIYISHPTEFGTLYSLGELEALSRLTRKLGMPLYVDGARLAYALASEGTDVTLPDIGRLADVFYIGGTKAGALFGEAVVVPRGPEMLPHFFSLAKQHGAVLAKGRLLGVQFETLMEGDLYLRLAARANSLAATLRQGFEQHGWKAAIESTTNQQFFTLPNDRVERLLSKASFELWGPPGVNSSTVRFVTSWSTTAADVTSLLSLL